MPPPAGPASKLEGRPCGTGPARAAPQRTRSVPPLRPPTANTPPAGQHTRIQLRTQHMTDRHASRHHTIVNVRTQNRGCIDRHNNRDSTHKRYIRTQSEGTPTRQAHDEYRTAIVNKQQRYAHTHTVDTHTNHGHTDREQPIHFAHK